MLKSEQAELPVCYPRTEFIDTAASELSPLGVGLVRAVYLAQHFGQGNVDLVDRLAVTSSGEVCFWGYDEREKYGATLNEVSRYFAENGASRLAAASLEGAPDLEAENHEFTLGVKTDFIRHAWQVCRDALPTGDELRAQPPMHELARDVNTSARAPFSPGRLVDSVVNPGDTLRQVAEARQTARNGLTLTRLIMATEVRVLLEGRLPGTYEVEPFESMLREVVIRGRRTGSGMFNQLFFGMEGIITKRALRSERRELRKVWETWHPGERFLPKNW